MDLQETLSRLEHRSLDELYFLAISLVLAFGVLQTTGTALQTDRPVVSVVSCSMYPQLHVGDVLVVQGTEFSEIEEGDIVVYSVKKVNITVDGERYELNGSSEPVETAAGSVSVQNVVADSRGEAVAATLEFDGNRLSLREGAAYDVGGTPVEVTGVQGMSIPIVHRVVEKRESSLATKGDNNDRQLEFENSIEPEQIHGKTLFLVPRIGGLKLLAMDLVGFEGDRPLVLDTYPSCSVQNSYSPGELG